MIRLRKGIASRYFEELILAVIGMQFGEYNEDICGIVVSCRHSEDIISIWNKSGSDKHLLTAIR